MQTNRLLVITIALLLTLGSCSREADIPTPAERARAGERTLAELLRSASRGWAMTYFSRCDSLIFSTPSSYIGHGDYRGTYGYGGHYFTMTFGSDGQVKMLGDYSEEASSKPQVSEYAIGRTSSTALSFTVYNYIHQIVGDRFSGSSDFVYQGQDDRGGLLFTTGQYAGFGHEYIRLDPIAEGDSAEDAMRRAYEHRMLFEAMVNPQLRIYQSSRSYYRSGYYLKRRVETNMSLLREIESKRYYVFLASMLPDDWRENYKGFSALGSGYAGTRDGISFRPGLRFSNSLRFYDFERRGDRFVAELVRVYDPITRKERLESRHLYPQGIPTGYMAEIWDQGK